jgi:hypothetical protein
MNAFYLLDQEVYVELVAVSDRIIVNGSLIVLQVVGKASKSASISDGQWEPLLIHNTFGPVDTALAHS